MLQKPTSKTSSGRGFIRQLDTEKNNNGTDQWERAIWVDRALNGEIMTTLRIPPGG